MSIVEKDPVCGMVVDVHKFEITYAGVHYAFCFNCKNTYLLGVKARSQTLRLVIALQFCHVYLLMIIKKPA